MRIAAIALSGAVIFGVAVPATAAFILDQNQPSATVYMAAFSQTDLAQSFQTQDYNSIAGAGIHLYTNGTTGNITISLWDYLPNNGGTMMATGTAVGTPGEWVDVYWDSVAITPNTEYFLVFTDEGQGGGIWGDTNNPYPFGCVYANPGYSKFDTFDYTFRTWVVPAPGALALLGLAGLVRRRRR